MQNIKTPVYQTVQIREFERLAQERFSITGEVMMNRAGKAAADFLLRRWPQAKKITVFCGGGNNGGDGYVLAQQLRERNLEVVILQVGNQDHMKEDASNALAACKQAKIEITPFNDKDPLQHPDVIVDAICGIGLHDNLREEVVEAIKKMQKAQVPIFSIDIPTGINADTGQVLGAAVHADATITFIGLKLGMLTGSGMSYTGELILNDLQMPTELFSYVHPVAEKLHLSSFASYLKPRARDWHKGLSGHVLIVGGDYGFFGAPRMAAEAALRVGAGLVTVATRPENAAVLNIDCPEIMVRGIKEAADIDHLFSKVDIVVLGPGLGQSDWAKALQAKVFAQELPLVVDADALNLLSQTDKVYENWVLTPHPGEAGRLINMTAQEVQEDRLESLKAINKRYGGVCVLKGSGSLVLAPNSPPGLCDKGNPGMASGGMGDVLSGVIGGLIAQNIPIGDAAKLGVLIHAMAGDLAAKDGERGMKAMDLMPYIRRLSNFTSP